MVSAPQGCSASPGGALHGGRLERVSRGNCSQLCGSTSRVCFELHLPCDQDRHMKLRLLSDFKEATSVLWGKDVLCVIFGVKQNFVM